MRVPIAFLSVLITLPLLSACNASDPEPAAAKKIPIYDTGGNAKELIAQALKNAKEDDKRVLLQYGANWCGWCYKLHDLFKQNAEVSNTVSAEYEVVLVDTESNPDVAKSYGAEIQGIPYLTVLDAEGKVLTHQDTAALEEGDHHSPQKVLDFLNQWKVKPKDAAQVLQEGLEQAQAEQKNVLLHFGAPRCSWCRRLEEVLHEETVQPLLAKDYQLVKIDTQRMGHAEDVRKKYDPEPMGIPWIAILSPQGNVLATSNAPEIGNIGFPMAKPEREHFRRMLEQTAKTLTPEQLQTVFAAVEKKGEEK